ncbi:SDR family NAD(P)-dependent oxidoreductase [Flavobacterium sp. HJJ]|uniref:SDR family NAD(P)-dependent oxidoreductase n=1 Tax=Flavobacterium sp. HJJ TaxID=2783792 RepID=UPI00188D96D0|nr:SDR family oxidoreductase [Flavobacterium sp. HJJ]MBF4473037.1 SDR family oxidoreductase [Flavobacterium sp. HJJ]
MKVQDKVILVTGGGNGIGRELVLHLLSKKAKVIAIDRNKSALEETAIIAEKLGYSLKTFVVDITNKNDVEALTVDAIAHYGYVDGIINNAGIIQPFVKLNDLSYSEIERVIQVNLYGTLYVTKSFLPHLLTRPEGHIVNISSMGGFLPVPGQTIYGATKAAVKLLTEGLNSELSNTNVRVSVVFPGAIRTNIMGNSGLSVEEKPISKAEERILTLPSKAAKIIVDGMERNRYRIFVGLDSKFVDLYYRLAPKSAAAFICKKMKGLIK